MTIKTNVLKKLISVVCAVGMLISSLAMSVGAFGSNDIDKVLTKNSDCLAQINGVELCKDEIKNNITKWTDIIEILTKTSEVFNNYINDLMQDNKAEQNIVSVVDFVESLLNDMSDNLNIKAILENKCSVTFVNLKNYLCALKISIDTESLQQYKECLHTIQSDVNSLLNDVTEEFVTKINDDENNAYYLDTVNKWKNLASGVQYSGFDSQKDFQYKYLNTCWLMAATNQVNFFNPNNPIKGYDKVIDEYILSHLDNWKLYLDGGFQDSNAIKDYLEKKGIKTRSVQFSYAFSPEIYEENYETCEKLRRIVKIILSWYFQDAQKNNPSPVLICQGSHWRTVVGADDKNVIVVDSSGKDDNETIKIISWDNFLVGFVECNNEIYQVGSENKNYQFNLEMFFSSRKNSNIDDKGDDIIYADDTTINDSNLQNDFKTNIKKIINDLRSF